jgi:hypothetical protein
VAIKLLDALKQSLHMIVGIEGTIENLYPDQTTVSDQLKKEELGEMGQIIETRDTAAQQLQRHIEVLEVSARNAAEAAAKAEEELQGAYAAEFLP